MKTYKRYDPSKGRTWPVCEDKSIKWANYREAINLAYSKAEEEATFTSSSDQSLRLSVQLFNGELWTVTKSSYALEPLINRGRTAFDQLVALYDADRRWTRVPAQREA